MADVPTQFWSGYIVGLTVISLLALVWLVFNTYFSGDGDPELADHDHVWDNDLREGTNPAPLWWFWLILASMAFSVIYLMLFPGMGSNGGVMQWSQGNDVAAAYERYTQNFGSERERLTELPYSAMREEPLALRSGAHLFAVNCGSCHGADATGQAQLFPNLVDETWQWGGSETQIEQSIRTGRTAVMPGWQAALQDDGVAAVTEFVIALARGQGSEQNLDAGRTQYLQFCSACHGPEGLGNPLLGSPALNDDVWLYGGTYDAVYESIAVGRMGEMPPFDGRLSEQQIRLLTAWISNSTGDQSAQ